MFIIGDQVQVMEHTEQKYVGKTGEVIHVGTGIKASTQQVDTNLPKQETERRYSVKLDIGKELHYLTEQQLRKI